MFTQRRPSESICSTFGVWRSGSGEVTSPPARAPRRSLGFGRFGIGLAHLLGCGGFRFTKEVSPDSLAVREGPPRPGSGSEPPAIVRAHITPHQEGWRDWPVEAPATIAGESLERCQVQQAGEAWEMWGEVRSDLRPTRGGGFFLVRGRESEIGCH